MPLNDRIVLAGEFWFGASGAGLACGLRKLGLQVGQVDVQEHAIQGRSFPLRVAARLLKSASTASYNAAIINELRKFEPGALLTVKGTLIAPATLSAARSLGIKTVNYYPDYHFDYAGFDTATLDYYDHFFTTKSFQVDYLKSRIDAAAVRFLHHGYSSLVHRPLLDVVSEDDYVTDVLYVGNYSRYKEHWLEAIARKLPGVSIMIVGAGWPRETFARTANVTVPGWSLSGDAFASILQRARINISIHSGRHDATGWEDLVSTRTFEIPACKGFMLHIDNHEVRSLFEPGSEIGVFTSEDDLVQKIKAYLADPRLRAEMIERAYARCVPAYSYDNRAHSILEAIA